ncbi:MAG TPA: ABC transporter permease [Blastocatellia bacterium]
MNSLIAANISQRPLRTAISVIGVALGVILITLFAGLARGVARDAAQRQSNTDAEIRFLSGENMSLAGNPLMTPARYADAILHGVQPTAEDPDIEPKPPIEGVAAASPVGVYMQAGVAGFGFEMVDGLDYESFIKTTRLNLAKGRGLGDGRTSGSEYEVVVDRYYADTGKDLDGRPVDIGSRITVLGHQFTVVGIYEPSVLARVKIPLHTMQQLLGGVENCTFVMVKCQRPELADQVIEQLRTYYPGHHVISTSEIPALYSQGLGPVEVFLKVVIGLAVVISTLVILLAMYTTIIERTREIGILKSLGASKGFIVITIEKEAALISAFGVLLGFLAAVIGKLWLEANTRLLIDLQPKWLLIAALIGVFGGILGAIYPAMRAANLDPVEAISYD